ncbi:MurR/RpiR family transcriptional regulator [Bifidobacterium psychraerophilum]|jgi:DNA-binding MurR/RpiR family transcriptional regulator|uniref:MurR/RpiR family transcriptional regulator n=1 Tax=Bifidobacterium psychraerophilum TaxID=218140 RepID=UPI0023F25EC7|nr:MurR/RpiR family transcriptional regulator [Bifidobacterium psychraerophilum]MCI1659552.1 MurR/RpiR family transcriptional regulator [Bifidobacterium psychraerophilum]MCI1804480.1 MurR/RpiR family transcriptional regulator [Bifidobacterium psychraerophilum]MCI2176363.1 MurR/RpiR family transcriptional regulator [Bifidobacterium psychraerophilum]MCI2181163.1 MurR/RpiR family transcriptional regulator [Bifidobacterium psychraerophilum]
MNDPSSTSTVVESIKSAFSGLSNAERLVARSILSDYPASCLGPVAVIAKNAGVSAPSVVRFAKSLGYSSYIEFRDAVLSELAQQSKGPLDRARQLKVDGDLPRVREKMEILLSTATRNLAAIPDTEWDSLATMLADTGKNIFVAGGRFSTAVARILALNLQLLRPGVILLDDLDQRDKGILLDMNRKSVLVVFDFYRYQKSVIKAAHVARQKGATIVLISDGDISPISADASIVLPVSTTSFLPMSGLSTATTIIEILLGDVYAKIGKDASTHLAQWELFTGDETLQ